MSRLLGLVPNPVLMFESIKQMAIAKFGHIYEGVCPRCGAKTVSRRSGDRTCECGGVFTMCLAQRGRLVA